MLTKEEVKKHPALQVDVKEYRRQLKAVSSLGRYDLYCWLRDEFPPLDESKALAADIQMRLAARKESSFLSALASHPHLLPRTFKAIMERQRKTLNKTLSSRSDLTDEQFQMLVEASDDRHSFWRLHKKDNISKETREQIFQAAKEKLSSYEFKTFCVMVLRRQKNLSVEEFEKILSETEQDMNGGALLSFPSLSAKRRKEVLEKGDYQELLALASNSNGSAEETLSLLRLKDVSISLRVAGSRPMDLRMLKEIISLPQSVERDGAISCFVLRCSDALDEDALVQILELEDSLKVIRTNRNLFTATEHYYNIITENAEDLPVNLVENMLKGVYGKDCLEAALLRKEASESILAEMVENFSSLSDEGKWRLTQNPSLSVDLQRKLSYQESIMGTLLTNPSLRVDDSFAWRFIAFGSTYYSEYFKKHKRHGDYEFKELVVQAEKTVGEDFLRAWPHWERSLKDLKQTHDSLFSID